MSKKRKIQLDQLTKETFTGTQVGVLLEDIDAKLRMVSESYGLVTERLSKIEKGQETAVERLDNLEVGQIGIISKLDKMETKLDATFEAVGDVKVEITGMREKDEELNRRVIVLEKRVAI